LCFSYLRHFANLLLSRAGIRQKEVAIRAAVGQPGRYAILTKRLLLVGASGVVASRIDCKGSARVLYAYDLLEQWHLRLLPVPPFAGN